MCSTDQTADNLRSLEPASVVEMAADAVASAPGVNPLGWDSSNGTEMTKNGAISGGTSRISKFLPGAFDATDDEINVAVAVNQSGATPPSSLLRNLAQVAADASVPASYDLFDAGHRCRNQLGLTTGEQVPPGKPAPSGPAGVPRGERDLDATKRPGH